MCRSPVDRTSEPHFSLCLDYRYPLHPNKLSCSKKYFLSLPLQQIDVFSDAATDDADVATDDGVSDAFSDSVDATTDDAVSVDAVSDGVSDLRPLTL